MVLIVGPLLALAGCGDYFHAGPIAYKPSERAATDLKDKPNLQEAVRKTLADLFGPAPQEIKIPPGSGFPEGGRRLAGYEGIQGNAETIKPITYVSAATGGKTQIAGGYGLYRKYCLHCHGLQGGGDGPTSAFLYPRPRDYRPGIFKFTSTAPSNPKPTRDDFRKTLRYGLHGTSMPAFEALMTPAEIEQVIDYVVFLSIRGEVEKNLIDEAKLADKDEASAIADDTVKDLLANIVNNWKAVEGLVVAPKARRVPPTRESVMRGRDIFLGINKTGNKVVCTDCHGPQGLGNGASFVERRLFDKIVFAHLDHRTFGGAMTDEQKKETDAILEAAIASRYREVHDEERSAHHVPGAVHEPEDAAAFEAKYKEYHDRMMTAWKPGSLDDWGNPLRPANLNLGVYKGGRRPIDLYWRIAKGINGAKMPAHSNLLPDEQIWDVVNFVLALPTEPDLLKDAEMLKKNAAMAPPAAVTQR